jgi:V8-like Glu-specific endopeptidase
LIGNANQDWGAVAVGSALTQPERFVNIIQHPGGGPKQIALYHNVVVSANVDRVQYLTDTMPGSSGSPVFDSAWQLVAIHHAGGWLKQPGSKEIRFCNEGIAVKVLADNLLRSRLWGGHV